MAGVAGSGNAACGHPVPPGSWFCPVCGQPAAGSAAPSQPSTAPLPVVPASPQSTFSAPVAPAAAPLAQPDPPPWESWYAPRRPPPPPPSPARSRGRHRTVCNRPADPDTARVDGLGPAPPDDVPATMLGGLRLASAPGGPRRPRRPLVPVIVAAALVAVVAGIVIFRGHSGGTAAAAHGHHAVCLVAGRAAAGRGTSVRAAGAERHRPCRRHRCGHGRARLRPVPAPGRADLRHSASSRQRLLSRLGSLPGRSLLPAAMLRDLTSAWQASAEVDTDLARWAQDMVARDCPARAGPTPACGPPTSRRARPPRASRRSPASGTRSPGDMASPPTSRTSSNRSGTGQPGRLAVQQPCPRSGMVIVSRGGVGQGNGSGNRGPVEGLHGPVSPGPLRAARPSAPRR